MKFKKNQTLIDRLRAVSDRLKSVTKESLSTAVVNDIARYEDAFKQIVENVITEEIYSYENYQGEGKIKESVRFDASVSDGKAKIGWHLDADTSEAKLLPGNTYAAFFEKPVEFNSFIDKTNPTSMEKVRYRPFFRRANEEFNLLLQEVLREAVERQKERLLLG